MHQSPYTIILIGCLVLFGIYRRVRRNIGWQQLNPGRLQVRAVIFFVMGLLFLAAGAIHPISLLSDALGVLIGLLLAYYSAGLTVYEQRDGRWYYRPNTWIGGIVIALFFGRLVYRLYTVSQLKQPGGLPNGQPGGMSSLNSSIGNPWTAGLLLIMFAYYVVYCLILIRKHKTQPGSVPAGKN